MRCHRAAFALLLVAGCSQAPDQAGSSSTDAAAPRPPAIGPTTAPGVAFTYRYGFRLPPTAIAGAQEAHAAACEKLGVARCRITGMQYRLLGENAIEAMLSFRLAPDLARAFGREGILAVERARGRLIDADITGDDAATAIVQADRQRAEAVDTARGLDARIAASRSTDERAGLQTERGDLAREAEAARVVAAAQRAALASTPMTFTYRSGPAIRGFDPSAPLAGALDTMVASAQFTLAALLGILAIFGPPVLGGALLWLAWHYGWPQVRWLFERDDRRPRGD